VRKARVPVASIIPVTRTIDMLLHPGEPFDFGGRRVTYWGGVDRCARGYDPHNALGALLHEVEIRHFGDADKGRGFGRDAMGAILEYAEATYMVVAVEWGAGELSRRSRRVEPEDATLRPPSPRPSRADRLC
jgi:hypothetical protein